MSPPRGLSREQAVAAMAERFIMLYLHVERGLLPLKQIEGVLDWRVREMHPPIAPPARARPVTDEDYRHVRVSMPTPAKAHVSAVARDANGRWRALVIEMHYRKPIIDQSPGWRITELTHLERAREPRLVPRPSRREPEPAAGLRNPAAERVLQARKSASLYELVDAVRRSHQAEYDALRGHADAVVPATDTTLRELLGQAAAQTVAWDERLEAVAGDHRQTLARRSSIDQLRYSDPADPSPPEYLAGFLGDPPEDAQALIAWRRAAGVIEGFRHDWNVEDPTHPLGPARPSDAGYQHAREQAQRRVRQLVRELSDRERQLHERDAQRSIEPPGLDLD